MLWMHSTHQLTFETSNEADTVVADRINNSNKKVKACRKRINIYKFPFDGMEGISGKY